MSEVNIPGALEKYFKEELPAILERQKIPGASIVVIKDGQILFMQGFGYKNYEQKLPVTTKSLFAIGSTSKAFAATVLGTLVDEGKLNWDDRVIDHIPEFRTKDPVTNMQLTIRDIQCHRSGLPRHDLAWLLTDFSRQELLEHIAYLEPFVPFRSKFHYNNFMWMVAGIVSERITGKSWEQNVRERIFEPIGMQDANFSVTDSQKSPDFALPYEVKEDQIIRTPFRQIDAVGPAGSINAHIEDYARWIMLNLNRGEYQGKRVISAESLEQIHAPQMAMPIDDDLVQGFRMMKGFSDLVYTLGWVSVSMRGRKQIMHAGGIDGFSSFITLIPEENIGVGVLTNSGGITSHYGITWEIVDRLLGDAPVNWVEQIAAFEAMMRAGAEQADKDFLAAQVHGTQPSHPLQEYAGFYTHPAYGTLQLEVKEGILCGRYNQYEASLNHYHYDTFQLVIQGGIEFKFPVRFISDVKGKVGSALIPLEPKVADIEFTKKE